MIPYASPSDRELCRRIHKKYGTTYYLSTLRFPSEIRRRVHAIYAFVRVPDEWVDNPAGIDVATSVAKLQEWRDDMFRGLAGAPPEHPVMRAYCDVALECGIPTEEATCFLDAMEADLTIGRYESYDDLRQYMRGSACTVGVLMCYAMGAKLDEDLLDRAKALGEAMQLTNFLRDIGEDLERGRIYMPLDELASFGLSEQDLLERRTTTAFANFMRFQIARARSLYALSDPGIDRLPPQMQNAVRMARILYCQILDRIEANSYDVFSKRARTSLLDKVKCFASITLGLRRTRSPQGTLPRENAGI